MITAREATTGGNMTGTGRKRTRKIRKWTAPLAAALVAAPLAIAAFATPSGAAPSQEGAIPEDANFTLAGISAKGETLTTGAVVNGDFSYCSNANGLGSELYFNASASNGVAVHHASVSPMVIPLHIGLVTIVDPTNEEPIDGDFITLGVVEGTPAPFGATSPSSATYGGLVVSNAGIGIMAFDYANDASDCSQSKVMPILQPLIDGNAPAVTSTTAAPTTAPSTTTTTQPTTTTTVAPSSTTTTEATTTTTEATTTTSTP
ncbi:MAG: hypothetical protein M9942_02750 [Microthrixaceae bacterium]|nr:hypothetical protein [Microthrixaceae bacterium]